MSHSSRQLPSTRSQMSLGSGWKLLGLESMRSRLSESKLGGGFPCLTSECQWKKWKGEGLVEDRAGEGHGVVSGGVSGDLYN